MAEKKCRYRCGEGWPMPVARVDSTGHLVLFERLDQANYGSISIAIAKAETALNFRRSTKIFEDAIAAGDLGHGLATVHRRALARRALVVDDVLKQAGDVSGKVISVNCSLAMSAPVGLCVRTLGLRASSSD